MLAITEQLIKQVAAINKMQKQYTALKNVSTAKLSKNAMTKHSQLLDSMQQQLANKKLQCCNYFQKNFVELGIANPVFVYDHNLCMLLDKKIATMLDKKQEYYFAIIDTDTFHQSMATSFGIEYNYRYGVHCFCRKDYAFQAPYSFNQILKLQNNGKLVLMCDEDCLGNIRPVPHYINLFNLENEGICKNFDNAIETLKTYCCQNVEKNIIAAKLSTQNDLNELERETQKQTNILNKKIKKLSQYEDELIK